MIQESAKPFDEVDSNGLVDTFLDFISKNVFLVEITETRIYCGFRENMIQESAKPFDEVDSNGLVDSFLDFISKNI